MKGPLIFLTVGGVPSNHVHERRDRDGFLFHGPVLRPTTRSSGATLHGGRRRLWSIPSKWSAPERLPSWRTWPVHLGVMWDIKIRQEWCVFAPQGCSNSFAHGNPDDGVDIPGVVHQIGLFELGHSRTG